jgi:hypothetical protein
MTSPDGIYRYPVSCECFGSNDDELQQEINTVKCGLCTKDIDAGFIYLVRTNSWVGR